MRVVQFSFDVVIKDSEDSFELLKDFDRRIEETGHEVIGYNNEDVSEFYKDL